jgi:hypothetical protein
MISPYKLSDYFKECGVNVTDYVVEGDLSCRDDCMYPQYTINEDDILTMELSEDNECFVHNIGLSKKTFTAGFKKLPSNQQNDFIEQFAEDENLDVNSKTTDEWIENIYNAFQGDLTELFYDYNNNEYEELLPYFIENFPEEEIVASDRLLWDKSDYLKKFFDNLEASEKVKIIGDNDDIAFYDMEGAGTSKVYEVFVYAHLMTYVRKMDLFKITRDNNLFRFEAYIRDSDTYLQIIRTFDGEVEFNEIIRSYLGMLEPFDDYGEVVDVVREAYYG